MMRGELACFCIKENYQDSETQDILRSPGISSNFSSSEENGLHDIIDLYQLFDNTT